MKDHAKLIDISTINEFRSKLRTKTTKENLEQIDIYSLRSLSSE